MSIMASQTLAIPLTKSQQRGFIFLPIKANLVNEQLSVQMSWGNGGCTRAGSPGDQQTRESGPWAAQRSRAMMRANEWGHDDLTQAVATSCHKNESLSTVDKYFWNDYAICKITL